MGFKDSTFRNIDKALYYQVFTHLIEELVKAMEICFQQQLMGTMRL